MKWFRVWHGSATDPKWRTVSRRAGPCVAIVYAIWTTMLESASANASERGELDSWNDETVGDLLGVSEVEVAAVRDAMQGLVLDGNRIMNWEKFQPKREDNSAERAKAWRERNRTQPNAPDRDTELDTEKKERVERAPSAAPTRGTRFSIESITEPWKQFCLTERPDLDPSATFDRCRDYWIAQAGQRGVKRDWDAVWRNWVRNEKRGANAKSDLQRRTSLAREFLNFPDVGAEPGGAGGDQAAAGETIVGVSHRTG